MSAIKTRIKVVTYLNSGTECYYGQAKRWWLPFWHNITDCNMNKRMVEAKINDFLMRRSTKQVKYINYP